MKFEFDWPCSYLNNMFKYITGSQISAPLAERSKVSINLRYL